MKISVIVCAYNAEATIPRTIESVLNQTYQDFEIVIINDGSTDGTLEIAERYQAEFPKQIVLESIPNGGLANARNHGIALCSGELYINLDSDDYLEPDTFEKAIAVIERDPQIDVCFYGYKSFDINGNFFDYYSATKEYPEQPITGLEAFQLMVCRRIWFYQGNAVYRTKMIRDNGIINHSGLNHGEDIYFISRSLLAARKVACFQGDNFCYMVRTDSMNHSSFNASHFQPLELSKLLEEDVRRDHPDQLDEILPYVWTERAIQTLAIIKRMARCFSLREYLRQVHDTAKLLRSIDKTAVWGNLDKLKQAEFMICRHSVTVYYYMTKAYDARNRKG